MTTRVQPPPEPLVEPYYPSGDGEPMAETEIHVLAIIQLLELLKLFLHDQTDVYVVADIFWYYERGNPDARKSPDIMVIKGVGRHLRRSFFSWKEKRAAPNVIFEMSSKNTWRGDLGEKRDEYARLGVREYFLFDPENRYLRPQFQGFRLEGGIYVPIPRAKDGSLFCKELGLNIRPEGLVLRLFDARTGDKVLTRAERVELEKRRADEAEQLARREKGRAEREKKQAERERKRAEREKKRAEQEKKQTKRESKRAEREKQRAEQERQRVQALEAELARLQKLLGERSPEQQ
jgi:Uma2 family endonuclease